MTVALGRKTRWRYQPDVPKGAKVVIGLLELRLFGGCRAGTSGAMMKGDEMRDGEQAVEGERVEDVAGCTEV